MVFWICYWHGTIIVSCLRLYLLLIFTFENLNSLKHIFYILAFKIRQAGDTFENASSFGNIRSIITHAGGAFSFYFKWFRRLISWIYYPLYKIKL
jgi:hypothetical protein